MSFWFVGRGKYMDLPTISMFSLSKYLLNVSIQKTTIKLIPVFFCWLWLGVCSSRRIESKSKLTYYRLVVPFYVLWKPEVFWCFPGYRWRALAWNGHSVHPLPPCAQGGGSWASNQIFKKGGLDRISTFTGGFLGKRGDFFQGGCYFHIKKIKIWNI